MSILDLTDDIKAAVLTAIFPLMTKEEAEMVYEDLQQAGVLRNMEAERQMRQDAGAAALREAADEMPSDLAYPQAWLMGRAAWVEGGIDEG